MSRDGVSAAERARRLIALLGQLAPARRIRIAELAAEVGATEAELTSDLETLSLCGVAPYYPDDYMPLVIEDGYVEVIGALPALKGPVRLSSAEAGALAAALQAAGFTAEDDLTARLLDATGAAGFHAEDLERTIRAATTAHQSEVYETLARATERSGVVRIEYVRSGSEEIGVRDIEPMALFGERGAWYVTAWCRRAGDWRTFRFDRIRSAESTGVSFDRRRRSEPPGSAAFSVAALPVARILFSADEPFIEREWPGARVVEQQADGGVIVVVPYAGTDWISRRIVARLGAAKVIEPAEIRVAVRELAESILGTTHG